LLTWLAHHCTLRCVQICVQRFNAPGWRITELLNGKRTTLNTCCSVIHTFANNIIQQRRKLLAQQRAGGAAATTNKKEQETDDSSAQDLLSLFMETKGADGKPLNDKQLVDTVINFIIAGRDTVAQVGGSWLAAVAYAVVLQQLLCV
jgi:fatty acid omega-hydroxylase